MEKDLERLNESIVLLRKLSEYQNKLSELVKEISDEDDNYYESMMEKFQQPFSDYFDAIKGNLVDMLIVDFAFSSRKSTTTL